MKKLMNALMFSCKKASELLDKKSELPLSFKEKVTLRMHTAMCDGCKAYQKQSVILDVLLHTHFGHSDETKFPLMINHELKKRIISKL